MKGSAILMVLVAVALAAVGGAAAGHLGAPAVVGVLGLGIALAAFVDLRITLLCALPVIVLLPELPLSLPIRTEDLLMIPLTAAWLGRLAMGRDRWPSTPLNAPLMAVVAVDLVAMLWGLYRGTTGLGEHLYSASFFFLKTVEVTLLYFITVAAVRDERDVRTFAYVLCAAGAALGVWGMVQRGAAAGAEPITGPAGHNGYSLLGLTLVVLLAVIAGLVLTRRSRFTRTALVLAAFPVLYSLMFTLSRQSYVGAAAVLLAVLWFRDRRLLVPTLALAVLIPFVVPGVVARRAASIVRPAPDVTTGALPYATRLNALRARLPEVAYRSPALGFGPAALPPGYLDNQYLLTFYYTGIIGLAAFLWLLWRAFRTARTAYRRAEGGLAGLPLAWAAATIGLAIAGLAGSPFVAVRVREVYWLLAALAVAASGFAAPSAAEPAAPDGAEHEMEPALGRGGV